MSVLDLDLDLLCMFGFTFVSNMEFCVCRAVFRNMDSSSFIVIYPTYLDSTKTVKVGRRISKEECVEEPSILDLSDACRTLNYRHVVEVRLLS